MYGGPKGGNAAQNYSSNELVSNKEKRLHVCYLLKLMMQTSYEERFVYSSIDCPVLDTGFPC